MEGDFHGIRIVPPVLLFDNTVPGTLYTLNMAIKNVSGGMHSIRYAGLKGQHFKLKVKNPENPIATGLSVPAVLQYQPRDETEITDKLVIIVDEKIIEVPIFGYPTRPALEIKSHIDFGTVVATSKVITSEMTLVNSGSKVGEFKIDYSGSKPIAITPNQGSVPPDSVQAIKIELVTNVAGSFKETAEMMLEGREPLQLTISGNVVKPSLEVLSAVNEQQIKHIAFGSTYYGTDRVEHAILYNSGPEVMNFVAVLDENGIAQELGVDLTQTATAYLMQEDVESGSQGHPSEITSLISAIPNQGVLCPYQKIPIFFRFSPSFLADDYKKAVAVCNKLTGQSELESSQSENDYGVKSR